MNQNKLTLQLADFMSVECNPDGTKDGWGVEFGESVRNALFQQVNAHPEIDVFEISFKGIKRIDVSFPREAVLYLAKLKAGKQGFVLTGLQTRTQIENIDGGVHRLDFAANLIISGDIQNVNLGADCIVSGNHLILGKPSKTNRPLVEYVLRKNGASTSEIAKEFDLQVNNASNKLKQLVEDGFLLRKEQSAATGGVEYYYYPIK